MFSDPEKKRELFVSVVIPTYNRSKNLLEALQSFRGQEFPREYWEIIVVIDGSTDGTEEMLHSLKVDFCLRWFVQPNKGPSAARNRGVREAGGDLVLFFDDDMRATPRLLREHVRLHKEGNNCVVMGDVRLTDDTVILADYFDYYYRWFDLASLQMPRDACVSPNTSVRRTHIIEAGGFDENLRAVEDYELGYRLFRKGFVFKGNPQALAYQSPQKKIDHIITADAFNQGFAGVHILRKHPDYFDLSGLRATFFSGSRLRQTAKQLLLALCPLRALFLFALWRCYSASKKMGKSEKIQKGLEGPIRFLNYCKGVRAAGGTLREVRRAVHRRILS